MTLQRARVQLEQSVWNKLEMMGWQQGPEESLGALVCAGGQEVVGKNKGLTGRSHRYVQQKDLWM